MPLPLASLGVVVRLDGGPVTQGRQKLMGPLDVNSELGGNVGDAHAPTLLHKGEAGSEKLILSSFHPADPRVASQEQGRDPKLGTALLRLP